MNKYRLHLNTHKKLKNMVNVLTLACKDLTIAEIAKELGFSKTYIQNLVNILQKMSINALRFKK